MNDQLLAWEVTVDDLRCITFALTAPKARWNAVNSLREAGYYDRRGGWPMSIKAKRVAYLDNSLRKQVCGRKCFSPESI